MFSNEMARAIQNERIRRIESDAVARADIRFASRSNRSSRSIRRSIGRRMIEIGRAIAADQPSGSIGELAARQ